MVVEVDLNSEPPVQRGQVLVLIPNSAKHLGGVAVVFNVVVFLWYRLRPFPAIVLGHSDVMRKLGKLPSQNLFHPAFHFLCIHMNDPISAFCIILCMLVAHSSPTIVT